MYTDFDKNVKAEVITLSDLKGLDYKSFYSRYYRRIECEKRREYPNKSREEIKEEIEEEIKKTAEKSAKETKEKYYEFNSEKVKEIEYKFKQKKLKVSFICVPKILRDGKFYTISGVYFTLYDNKFFNKLYEIRFEEFYNITSVIQLDNKDIVFFTNDLIIIYRLKEEKYFLFQKIEENRTGYGQQYSYSHCDRAPKTFRAEYIKEISGNRFISVSNYGFKIYSLNEKNEYSISLLESYYEGLETIIELDKNSFIFCSRINHNVSYGGPAHNELIIDKIDLREITEKEIKNKLIKKGDDDSYSYDEDKDRDKIDDEKAKKLIESLKFTYDYNQFIEYSTRGDYHYFKGNAILKNKYLIVGIDNNFLIIDILSGRLLKRYELFVVGEDNLYNCNANIEKYNNNEKNEFLINIKGNIVLFELTKDNNLKIINQSFFENIKSIKLLNEKNNVFYDDGIEKKNSYNVRNHYSYSYGFVENDVSIFY